jgi:hypothetical protein
MTKEQFIQLIKDIAAQMPDKGIRQKFLFNEFNKYGLSVFDGTTNTNYFYNELKKQIDGEKSIFDCKVIRQNGTIAFLDKFTCFLKITEQYFADLEDLLTVKRYDNVINNLNKINDFAKLFSGKYSGQSWPVGAIPETALEITEIELLFKYWKQIIQETINAAPAKQKEIDNFLNLCDIGISTILPKCKDPFENKELTEYWLSQYKALKIFVATFERHIPKTSAAEPLKEAKPEPANKLIDLFDDVNNYERVIKILAGTYIHEGSHLYIIKRVGYKREIVQLILCLHSQGYYKANRRPTNKEIQRIAQNTFGVTISKDTVKQNTVFRHSALLEIIPPAINKN